VYSRFCWIISSALRGSLLVWVINVFSSGIKSGKTSGKGWEALPQNASAVMLRNKIQGLEATDPEFPQLTLAERRAKLRVRTYIRLDMKVGEERSSAIVTDLSLSGMRIRSNFEIEQDDTVEVAFPDAPNSPATAGLACSVVWVTAMGPSGRTTYEAGLSFDPSDIHKGDTWVRYVLEQLGFDESKTFQKRKYLRAAGKVPARIFTSKPDVTVTGEILNLGVGGALMASTDSLEKDDLIHCEICLWRILPALRLPCKVMAVRQDSSLDEGAPHYLHSLLFLGMDTEQVKLLGNYVIHLINQCGEDDDDEKDADAEDADAEDADAEGQSETQPEPAEQN
jgi:PilZ domain-containing protein